VLGAWFHPHLARLGGALVTPRARIRSALDGADGGLGDLLPWMFLVAAAARPVSLGRAILTGRSDPVVGLGLAVQRVLDFWMVPLLVVVAFGLAATALRWTGRRFEGAVADAASVGMVPLLLLASVGVLLDRGMGVDVSALPHHPIRWGHPSFLPRLVIGYGWSLGLWGLLVKELVNHRTDRTHSP
jgi:hypothetical protein